MWETRVSGAVYLPGDVKNTPKGICYSRLPQGRWMNSVHKRTIWRYGRKNLGTRLGKMIRKPRWLEFCYKCPGGQRYYKWGKCEVLTYTEGRRSKWLYSRNLI